MAGEVSLFPSIALAERIFQAPKSRIRSSANACGYTSIRKRKQSKTPKTLAEIWRSACEAERAEFLRACGAELWVA
jgi:hypothetical protein